MIGSDQKRDIPRAWEIDWALPAQEGGTRWSSYRWLLDHAADLGVAEVTILGATYDNLGDLGRAIGSTEASALRVLPHSYRVGDITVHGVSSRGSWYVRGPVLVAWARDDLLAEVENQRPAAIAAVASWPDRITLWRSVYGPERIGQVREEQESEFAGTVPAALDPRAAQAIDDALTWVNSNHSVLSIDEREAVAGALVALREADVPVDRDALQAHLMASAWSGGLTTEVVTLAERVARGQTPRHAPFRLK